MKKLILILALGGVVLSACTMQGAAKGSAAGAAAAVADAARPSEDKARDEHRKPVEMVEFAGIKSGDNVIDLLPGGGYFTRIFSKVVGAKGHVYGWLPSTANPKSVETFNALVADPAFGNISLLQQAPDAVGAPSPVDVVWTSQNYHDLHNRGGIEQFNAAVFKALKPGGVFVVLDHTAATGSGDSTSKTLHRIDPELVKKEVIAAGFKLEASSDALVNSSDTHALPVFDPSLRGMTDQFILKFRKPKK